MVMDVKSFNASPVRVCINYRRTYIGSERILSTDCSCTLISSWTLCLQPTEALTFAEGLAFICTDDLLV